MKQNVGSIDRTLRAIVGLGLISMVFIGPQVVWGWVGIVPLATAIMGSFYCFKTSLTACNTSELSGFWMNATIPLFSIL